MVHVPKMGRHSTGQARVVLSGQVHYLGEYGSPEAAAKYAELLAKWESGGRKPLRAVATVLQVGTVAELARDYLAHVDGRGRYRKADGRETSGRNRLGRCMKFLCDAIGDVHVRRLQPVHVRRFVDALVKRESIGRDYANALLRLAQAMLKWAAREDRLTREQWRDLKDVEGLSREDLPNRDHRVEKYCATAEEIERIAQAAGGIVGRMVRLQFAAGLRPGELLALRWCDLSREEISGCLTYTVQAAASKVAHRGKELTYAVPLRLLDGLVPTSPTGRVFHDGPETLKSYARALARASKDAGVPRVVPHGVRHAAITEACRGHGALAAQGFVQHSSIQVTSRYLHTRKEERYAIAAGLAAKFAQ